MANGIYFNKSEARTEYSLNIPDAISPVFPWSQTASFEASNGLIPWAQRPAIIPVKTSPLPAFASELFPVSFIYISDSTEETTVLWSFKTVVHEYFFESFFA